MRPGAGIDRIDDIADEWEQLADELDASPFHRAGWFSAWWRTFGQGELEILSVRRDGRLAGILPVARRRNVLASPTNWHTPAFGFLGDDPAARELAATIVSRRPRRVTLSFLGPEDPGTSALMDSTMSAGYRVLIRPRMRSPYISTGPGWEAYWAERGKKLRKEIRRRSDHAREEGSVEFRVVDGSGEWERAFEEGLRVEAAGWKGRGHTAVVSRPETRRFYTDVARWAAERGWLRVGFIDLQGRPAAFQLWLELGGVHYSLKRGYDPAFAAFGPGILLQHEIVSRAFRIGLSRFEFLGGAEEWKLRWTPDTHERVVVQAFAPTVAGRLDREAFRLGRPLAKRARSAAKRVRKRPTEATSDET